MKKIILLCALLVAAIWLSGCTGPQLKDCGEDMDCFQEAAESCTPAKVTAKDDAFGTEIYQEVRGGTTDACKYYLKWTKVPEALAAWEGKEMECTLPVEADIENMQQFGIDKCSGSLVDELKKLGLE